MSRDLSLDDLILGERSGSEHYEPGTESKYFELIDLIVEHYYTPRTPDKFPTLTPELKWMGDEDCLKHLIRGYRDEDFDANEFLEDFIITAGARVGPRKDTGLVLGPLISALYTLSYNDLVLDFKSWNTDDDVLGLGYDLEGEEHCPAMVTFKNLNAHELGNLAEYARIIHLGDAESVGPLAENSTFIVIGEVDVEYIGQLAKNCQFYLDPKGIYDRVYLDSGSESYRDYGKSEKEIVKFLKKKRAFFANGNSLYFPDGNGDWKEVKPK